MFFHPWKEQNEDFQNYCPRAFLILAASAMAETTSNLDLTRQAGDGGFDGGVMVIVWAVVGIFGMFVYCIPWVVASRWGVRSQAGIVILNPMLGWTFLGWVGALIWAVSAATEIQATPAAAVLAA